MLRIPVDPLGPNPFIDLHTSSSAKRSLIPSTDSKSLTPEYGSYMAIGEVYVLSSRRSISLRTSNIVSEFVSSQPPSNCESSLQSNISKLVLLVGVSAALPSVSASDVRC